jgi:hypothetical protein
MTEEDHDLLPRHASTGAFPSRPPPYDGGGEIRLGG